MSLGAVWAMWLLKYFPGKCYCGDLRKQEDILCIAPTCNIGLLNIADTTFEWCKVSIVGAGNIKEKKFGGSVWQEGNATCHNDFASVCGLHPCDSGWGLESLFWWLGSHRFHKWQRIPLVPFRGELFSMVLRITCGQWSLVYVPFCLLLCNLLHFFLESTFLSMSIPRAHKILGSAGHMKDLLGPEGCRDIEPEFWLKMHIETVSLA